MSFPPLSPGDSRRVRVSVREAADVLGWDARTVRRAVADGSLAGGREARAQRTRWFVYADALADKTPVGSARSRRRIAAPTPNHTEADLRAENMALREANLLLLAANAALTEARAAEQASDLANSIRAEAQAILQAANDDYDRAHRRHVASLSTAINSLQDVAALFMTPDDPRDLNSDD